VHPAGVEHWLAALKKADAKYGKDFDSSDDYHTAMADLLAWNGELRADSSAALKYYYWRKQISDVGGEKAAEMAGNVDDLLSYAGKKTHPAKLSDEQLHLLVDSIVPAMDTLKEDFGSLKAVYGDKFRVGRDDASWPVGGGGNQALGTATVRNVDYGPEREDHTRWGESGQTSTQIVVLSKPVRSWTAVPIGQSDRPDSPHYRDQAEKLFSPRKLKPTWYSSEDLAQHIESREVLEKASAKSEQ
jgi:acyl-homoserine lactone acylase PvdQ